MSNGIGKNPLNDISKVYLDNIAEAAVEPPKEKLKTDRNMFNIPKDEQAAAKERLLAKAKAKREKMKEETEDSLRDKRMERGGVDGNTNYKKPAPKFSSGPSKKKYDGMRAVDRVRDDIIKQYGKGSLINKKK